MKLLCRTFIIWAAALAIVAGVAMTVQTGIALARFDTLEYLPKTITLALIRVLLAGTTSLAVYFTLISWAHRSEDTVVRKSWWTMAAWGLLAALLFFPGAILLALASSYGTASLAFNLEWNVFRAGVQSSLTMLDLGFGFLRVIINMVFVGIASWLTLPWLSRLQWPLALKIGTVSVLFLIVRMALSVAVKQVF